MEEPNSLPPASNLDEFREPMPARAAAADGPTIADLTYDDTLDDIGRIARYGASSVALQRLVHVKLMSDTARSVGCVLCGFARGRVLRTHERALLRTQLTSTLPSSPVVPRLV